MVEFIYYDGIIRSFCSKDKEFQPLRDWFLCLTLRPQQSTRRKGHDKLLLFSFMNSDGLSKSHEMSYLFQKLATEVADLKAKSDDLLDKYRRSIAENDNMRKRLTKQIEDAKVYGIQASHLLRFPLSHSLS